jgi:hypothetical protein
LEREKVEFERESKDKRRLQLLSKRTRVQRKRDKYIERTRDKLGEGTSRI